MEGKIKVVLCFNEYRDYELEMRYKDEKYDVYSYELQDGIWGTCFEDLDEKEMDFLNKTFGEKEVEKLILMEVDEVVGYVPFSYVTAQGYSIVTKKGKCIETSERDMAHMCMDGCIALPDGSMVEPDAEDSPLREMGLI